MNKTASEIGMEKTNFASVHGLMNYKNISTARDMAILGNYKVKAKKLFFFGNPFLNLYI